MTEQQKRGGSSDPHLVQGTEPLQLDRHQSGVGERPPIAKVTRFVRPAHQPGVPVDEGHRVLSLYVGRRWLHPRTKQALIKVSGKVWNVARLMLEYAGVDGSGFVNACGYVECVEPSHWKATKPSRGTAIILRVNDRWQLYRNDRPVDRDVAVVAHIPGEPWWHVVRVLVDEADHRFVTLCGVAYDPGLLVITTKHKADCEVCLR